MNRFIRCFVAIACFFFCIPILAQEPTATAPLWQPGVSYEIGWQEMYTSHSDFFPRL